MKQFILLLFISVCSSWVHASEVTIQNRQDIMLTGMIDQEIATNFDSSSTFRSIYWQTRSGTIVSSKPYYIANNSHLSSVRFCVRKGYRAPECSDYYRTASPAGRNIQANSGNLTDTINGGEDLNVGDTFWATSEFTILQGQFSFLYHQVEDQDGNVLRAKFSNSVVSTLNGISLPTGTDSVRSCSIGGFAHGFPIYVSNCSRSVAVIYGPTQPVYETYRHMYYTQWGPFYNRQQGRNACSNSTYAGYSDWRLIRSNERPMTRPLRRAREAPYNLYYTGYSEVGFGMADDVFFKWKYWWPGKMMELRFAWFWQWFPITYQTAVCIRSK
ncbi:hypothetical protein [Vibrio brasiliensis]